MITYSCSKDEKTFYHPYFLDFASECIEDSDCPNDGQQYKCNNNSTCECVAGLYTTCIGTLPNQNLFNVFLSSKSKRI